MTVIPAKAGIQLPCENMTPVEVEVPPRQADIGYKLPRKSSQRFVASVD